MPITRSAEVDCSTHPFRLAGATPGTRLAITLNGVPPHLMLRDAAVLNGDAGCAGLMSFSGDTGLAAGAAPVSVTRVAV